MGTPAGRIGSVRFGAGRVVAGLWTDMDRHTLELLEFDKVRALVAARAACSLGKAAAHRIEPSVDPGEIHHRQSLTMEMVEALRAGLRPSFGGLHDIRPL